MTTSTLPAKTQRAAQIKLTKLNKKYDEAIAARNSINEEGRKGGFCEAIFVRERAAQASMDAIYAEMEAFRNACRAVGWYVSAQWLRYFEQNPSLHANRD